SLPCARSRRRGVGDGLHGWWVIGRVRQGERRRRRERAHGSEGDETLEHGNGASRGLLWWGG
ncbi:hypothetical protein, partial [Mycobacteroides sp. H092]|uniref:hypothetical protein n=1 Tax=Mycobacteroides sp. H092 TaxID=1720573 RepID=UPI002737D0A3